MIELGVFVFLLFLQLEPLGTPRFGLITPRVSLRVSDELDAVQLH